MKPLKWCMKNTSAGVNIAALGVFAWFVIGFTIQNDFTNVKK